MKGNFNRMKIADLTSTEKENLASKLFDSISVGLTLEFDDSLLEKLDLNITNSEGYTEFRPTLFAILELCNPPDSAKKRLLLAKAYSWLGAKYRKEAIVAYNNVLESDINLENLKPYPMFKDGQEVYFIEDAQSRTCLSVLWDLAKAYEGEYMFESALNILDKAWYLFPFLYTTLAHKFGVLKKLNRLDDIINIIETELNEEWTQPYTRNDKLLKRTYYRDSNYRCLIVDLEKYTRLKEKGYTYKPRPRKEAK